MTPLLINGMTKSEFAEYLIGEADKINSKWQEERFFTNKEIESEWIWRSVGDQYGFALSALGINLFEKVLGITPYILEGDTNFNGDLVVRLDKYMPYPYYYTANLQGPLLFIYSSEVTIMAALYNNDLNKLLDMYELSRNS